MQFGWVQTHIQFSVVCGPKFTGLSRGTREESAVNIFLSDFGYLVPFRRYSRSNLKLSEIAPNFACFWPPISLGGGSPELLDLHYKAHPDSDHLAKFHGDRPRQLGGSPAKERKK